MRSNGILSTAVVLAASAVQVSCSSAQHEERGILENTFDYVIVGGGTAGLVMAERLSQDPQVSVAVIEAGSYPQLTNPVIGQTPASAALFAGSSPLDTNPLADWNFLTEPQAGANGRKLHYARGKCFGGSSARNLMLYQRGTVGSYEKWAEAVGDDSYTWENMLPYFKKSVDFSPEQKGRPDNATVDFASSSAASDFSSSGGPLSVILPEYAQSFSSWVAGAMDENGISPLPGLAGGDLLGAQYTYATITPENVRDSSATSFLEAANGRDNLKVIELARADKVLFDTSSKKPRATGVQFHMAGLVPSVAHARKEVILSAGTFQSPQLLMLSGIGPADHLAEFKDDIPLVLDLPGVGQNMQDHIFFGPSYRVNVDTVTKLVVEPVFLASALTEYVTSRSGLLTSPVADFIGFEKLPRHLLDSSATSDLDSDFPSDWPEIEYLSAAGFLGDLSELLLVQPKDGSMYGTIAAALVAPLSRGNVTLKSSSGHVKPNINPNWLTHPTDQAAAVAAYKRVRQFWASDFMKPLLAGHEDEYFPGTKEVSTDEEILNSIRDNLMTVWHASCTCKMGKAEDPMAVVDKDAKVMGVEGLRVVDASSMALLPPGHPMSTIYAFAEKISDQIKKGM